MYELAKSLRAKMKAKAKSLANEKDSKVDSSDWSPAEPLNADVKTGMRPISRSAYKAGGKVAGEATEPRADRQPRKKTGEVKSWVDAKVNRNVKDANEEREGIKHVGGLKKGGAAKKADGGRTGKNEGGYSTQKDANETPSAAEQEAMRKEMERQRQKAQEEGAHGRKDGGAAKKADGGRSNKNFGGILAGPMDDLASSGLGGIIPILISGMNSKKAKGGAAKKADGGEIDYTVPETGEPRGPAKSAVEQRMRGAERVKAGQMMQKAFDIYNSMKSRGDPAGPMMKKGGAAKKMAKPKPRVGKFYGGALEMTPNVGDSMPGEYAHGGQPMGGMGKFAGMMGGQPMGGMGAMGGDSRGIGPSPAMTNPMNRKAGGRAKGKPHISIMINAGQKQPDPMGGAPMGGAPAGVPVPMSVPPPGGMPPMPMGGISMPPPAPPIGGGLPGGMPPMARRAGGRIARSYKDMDAGAGSGEGRLEKSEIQKRKR